jgi:hypothetical protein
MKHRFCAGAVLLLSLAGCSPLPRSTSDGGTNAESAVDGSTLAQIGEPCGGTTTDSCAPNLVCVDANSRQVESGESGTCLATVGGPALEGEACGDDVAIQRSCAVGLVCVFPTAPPISEHTPGVCTRLEDRCIECAAPPDGCAYVDAVPCHSCGTLICDQGDGGPCLIDCAGPPLGCHYVPSDAECSCGEVVCDDAGV